MIKTDYTDIVVEVSGQIGIIKFNRPDYLNAFGGRLLPETINAFRELNEHPDTVLTVLTGAGRFFSSGWDIRSIELIRTIIDHRKVFVLALNGPATGGGAAWFLGLADTVLAASTAHLHMPFSALALVPENGSIRTLAHSLGVHRANDLLIYGKRVTAGELRAWGTVSEVFPAGDFHAEVRGFLERQLEENDGESMMIAKKLGTAPLRSERLLAAYEAMDALYERMVEGAPTARFVKKIQGLQEKKEKKEKKEKQSKL
ncbi:peroxisomal D3,D2-enoyl-CoA isomerase [Cordyceps fumosorosea ARSEF 2679]|uniref:Peroxisomal D3,D2-enoyl-CoA isomerase n=1 Tax=Cordyceps fumosorosea (strain ARSEF 2679) TaxID=1081104 RepID=A0A167M3C3_CORFA|nr:peroxisomal D3,D2-enoyl-CoA isomerase [Cordyceps fumosorosea ARSEF 2679]OAA53866.1 peroxisomal D3,D2-enoyl-CoA isomerase [Cordyceps fumosorosea ARSEF 2679]